MSSVHKGPRISQPISQLRLSHEDILEYPRHTGEQKLLRRKEDGLSLKCNLKGFKGDKSAS